MIDLRQLRTLVALREAETLQAAADRLYVTPSALSHQLKELEEALGQPLFVRKTRPIVFTAAGQRLLLLADKVLPQVAEAEADLKASRDGEAGRLRMALECHSCFDWLLPATDRYRDGWPEVELDFVSGFEFSALDALLDHELDLVITSDPGQSPGLSYVPLFRYESVLVMARDHELAVRKRISPEDLSTQTLVTYPVEEGRLDVFRDFLHPAGVRPKAVRQAALTPMLVQLVASGRGVASLPDWVAADYVRRQLVQTRPLGAGLWCTLYAAVRTEDKARAYVAAFIETARRFCLDELEGVKRVSAKNG